MLVNSRFSIVIENGNHLCRASENEASSISQTSRENFLRKTYLTLSAIVLFAAVGSNSAIAQSEISLMEFLDNVSLLFSQVNESKKQQDYQTAEKSFTELIVSFSRLSEENQKQLDWLQSEFYYGRACCLSLQNKIEAAVNDFEKAVNVHGFTAYSRANADTDLDNIRNNERFVALMESIREYDYANVLRQSGKYQSADATGLPRFTYEAATSNNLNYVRHFFNLDEIAGDGDEISKIINLMKWVYDNIRHDGSTYTICEYTSIDIYNYHKSTDKGVNCRLLAIVLNEIYLAMGFKSRFVTCGPKDNSDVHVINSVFSTTLNKWLWMDPSFNAYWKDENGNLLSIAEVRERLIDDRPLLLNEDASWSDGRPLTRATYLDGWMAKNLYWFERTVHSGFNSESPYRNTNQTYIRLVPLCSELEPATSHLIMTHDAIYFWEH